jgi:hypothetical protein
MEADVTEKSQAVAATVVCAVIGGLAGYMFFTEGGRTLRQRLEPALDDFARELNNFRGTMQKALGVAHEGWRVFNEALGESGSQAPRVAHPHQSSPF